MLKIRLQRVGRKNDPSFRVVVTEHTNKPQTGNVLEVLGSYDARKGEPALVADRIKHWISKGAKTSDTIHNLLVRSKIIDAKTVNPLPYKKPQKKEETGAPKAASAPVAAATEATPEVKTEEPPAETAPVAA